MTESRAESPLGEIRWRIEGAITAFLQDVGRFRPCGVQDHLDVRRVLYETSPDRTELNAEALRDLRTRLSAMLARDGRELDRIAAAFDACFLPLASSSPTTSPVRQVPERGEVAIQPRLASTAGSHAPAHSQRTAKTKAPQRPQWRVPYLAVAVIAAFVLGTVLFAYSRRLSPDRVADAAAHDIVITGKLPATRPHVAPAPPQPIRAETPVATTARGTVEPPPSSTVIDNALEARELITERQASGGEYEDQNEEDASGVQPTAQALASPWLLTPPETFEIRAVRWDWSEMHWGRTTIAFIVLFFLLRAWLSVNRDEQRRRIAHERRQAEARRKRQELAEQAALDGEGATPDYPVHPSGPLTPEEVHDVAVLLTRAVPGGVHSDEVDGERTIDSTVAAGGRLVLVPAEAMQSTTWLILTDVEVGDHPYLPGIERTLDALTRHGVHLIRFHFRYQPDIVTRVGSAGRRMQLKQALERSPRAFVVIISRELRARGATGADMLAPWTALIGHTIGAAWADRFSDYSSAGLVLRHRQVRRP